MTKIKMRTRYSPVVPLPPPPTPAPETNLGNRSGGLFYSPGLSAVAATPAYKSYPGGGYWARRGGGCCGR